MTVPQEVAQAAVAQAEVVAPVPAGALFVRPHRPPPLPSLPHSPTCGVGFQSCTPLWPASGDGDG